MANNTITVSSTENTLNEVLRLNSPRMGSFDERSMNWGQQVELSGAEMEMGMDMGMGIDMRLGMGEIGPGFNQEMSFEGDVGILESMNAIPFTPGYDIDGFSSTFEDPFQYQSNDFSMIQTPIPEAGPAATEPVSESKEGSPDKKLLSFGPPTSDVTIFTSAGTQTSPLMTAEVYGMFFVAEDVYRDSIPTPGRLTELTCYRRNLFQISGNVTMSRDVTSFVDEDGVQVPVGEFRAILSAVESNEGKVTDIISVPWKSSQPTPGAPAEETAPAKFPLDLASNPELDPAMVSVPIAWKRLQFKHATANNGRRKGLQQHYVIKIDIEGKTADEKYVTLAQIQSGPIIVRGRSPRNFDSRKDVNLSAAERRADGKPRHLEPRQETPKVNPGVANGSFQFYALNALQQPLDLADWNTPAAAPLPSPRMMDAPRVKRLSVSHATPSVPTPSRPPVPKTKWNSDPKPPKQTHSTTQNFTPIDLSISETHNVNTNTNTNNNNKTQNLSLSLRETSPIPTTTNPPIPKRAVAGSPIESADLLYEYFPLSLDDWMPPVDAIYRPHVVHHFFMPPDLKAEQVRNKPKRYFSADD